MSTPTTVKRMRFDTETLSYDTYTFSDWVDIFKKQAMFAVEDVDGIVYDFTEWISELNMTHNDIDGEGAGRDKKSGKMKRVYVTNKHDFQIKIVDGVPQPIARRIFSLVRSNDDRQSFTLWWQHPCDTADIAYREFYCSTINYGAMRYNKSKDKCYFYGMSFKVIQM